MRRRACARTRSQRRSRRNSGTTAARCTRNAPERRAVEAGPRGEQPCKRVTRQHALLGFARRVPPTRGMISLSSKRAVRPLCPRTARHRRTAQGAFPRRQVVVPATRPYSRKHEFPVAANFAAQLQHLGPITIMNMQVNHRKTIREGLGLFRRIGPRRHQGALRLRNAPARARSRDCRKP